MSPNFLERYSNSLKIAIFVEFRTYAFLFSEGFRAACRLPAWHEGTSINYGTGHKDLTTYVSED